MIGFRKKGGVGFVAVMRWQVEACAWCIAVNLVAWRVCVSMCGESFALGLRGVRVEG